MKKHELEDTYFEWLCSKVCVDNMHNKLLRVLFDVPFRWIIEEDENRAKDGEWLRKDFCQEREFDVNSLDILSSCRVLEMMIALSVKIEDDTMYDPDQGDRTWFWFWMMVRNLGIMDMFDDNFNEEFVRDKLDIFMDRRFEESGEGSLFCVKKYTSKTEKKTTYTSKKMTYMPISEAKNVWLLENFDF